MPYRTDDLVTTDVDINYKQTKTFSIYNSGIFTDVFALNLDKLLFTKILEARKVI